MALFLVKEKTVDAYAYLIEELGFIEVANKIQEPNEVDSSDPLIVVDKDSKELYQIDKAGVQLFSENEITLTETTLKEIKSWEK